MLKRNLKIFTLLAIDENGGLICDTNNPIATLYLSTVATMTNGFTANITLKTDPTNAGANDNYGETVIAFTQCDRGVYLLWVCFYKGFIHIYAYRESNSIPNMNKAYRENRFLSIDYMFCKDKIVNLQIVANNTENAKLFVNGKWYRSLNIENVNINYDKITIGDLRPGRNLKFKGTLYDVSIYNRYITYDEIVSNYEYDKSVWNLDEVTIPSSN